GQSPSPTRRRALPVVLAGLGLLLAVAVIAWPWLRGTPGGPEEKPLAVTDLRVIHYRDKDNETALVGDLWTSPAAVRLNDHVQVLAGLSRPAFYYLIAFNPQGSEAGTIQLCQPEGEKGQGEVSRPSR